MEISVEEFLKLPEAVGRRKRKVDWDNVLDAVLNQPLTIREIQAIIKELQGVEVSYSEVWSWLSRVHGRNTKHGKIVVLKKQKDGRNVYLVTTEDFIASLQAAQTEQETEEEAEQ